MAEERDARRQAEIDRLLSAANVARLRGEVAEALAHCQAALALSPQDPALHELYGDLLEQAGQLSQALETYRQAQELAPDRASVEEKIARLSLELARAELRYQRLAGEGTTAPLLKPLTRKPVLSCLYSLLLPGCGQLYNLDFAKGLGILALVLLLLNYLASVYVRALEMRPPGQAKLGAILGHYLNQQGPGGKFLFYGSLVLLAVTYLFAIIEAWLRARQINREAETVPL